MAVTKELINYPLYKMGNGFEVKVLADKKIVIITPMGTEIPLDELNDETKAVVQPMLDFVEADLSHSFTPPEDELE